jgi:hypothetical protein
MLRLTCKNDVIDFIAERSCHVRDVIIKEKDGEVVIMLEVGFIYWLLYRKSFHRFIDAQIQSNKMLNLKYTVKII